jgi:hypothetical protein
VFTLNGRKVHKSEHKKKTLTPVWNEKFQVQVPSRIASRFEVELFDWNQVSLRLLPVRVYNDADSHLQLESAKSLGTAVIDLNSIDVIVPQMLVIPLHSEKHGTKGSIRINVQFTPGIIVRDRKNTSTFTGGAGRAMTTVGSAPIALGKGVGKGVFAGGKGVVHGVGHAGRSLGLVKKKDHAGNEILVEEEVPNGNGTHHEVGATNATGEVAEGAVSEHGMLSVTCVTSKDLVGAHEGKAYVQLKLGDKTQKTGHHKKTEWCVYLPVIIAVTGMLTRSLCSGTRHFASPHQVTPTVSPSRSLITRRWARTRNLARPWWMWV